MELFVRLGRQLAVRDDEVDLLHDLAGERLAARRVDGAGMERPGLCLHRVSDIRHTARQVLVALPLGAVVQHQFRPRRGRRFIAAQCAMRAGRSG